MSDSDGSSGQNSQEPDQQSLVERIRELEAEQAAMRETVSELDGQQQHVVDLFGQFKAGSISRRTFLTAVAALGGVGIGAGAVAGHSASPSWSNSTGQIGEETQPVDRQYARDLHFDEGYGGSLNVDGVETDLIRPKNGSRIDFDAADVNNVGSLSAGEAGIGEAFVNGRDPVSIADDDVTMLDLDRGVSNGSARTHLLLLFGDIGSIGLLFVSHNNCSLVSGVDIESQGNTTLSGTTGSDGVTSVAVDNGTTLYVENRSGNSQTYDTFEVERGI